MASKSDGFAGLITVMHLPHNQVARLWLGPSRQAALFFQPTAVYVCYCLNLARAGYILPTMNLTHSGYC